MKTPFTIICALGPALATIAFGQTSPAASSSTGGEATGKVVEFTAGASISLSEGSGDPVRYKISKNVSYINARGKMVKGGKIKKDRKVRVHFVKDGNDRVADKITVVKN